MILGFNTQQIPPSIIPEYSTYYLLHISGTQQMISSVQSLSHVRLFVTPWTAARQTFPVHHQLPELTQTQVHRVGDALQPSHPLSSTPPPAFNLSQHQGQF